MPFVCPVAKEGVSAGMSSLMMRSAPLTYKHIGEGDIPGRPSLDQICAALKNAQGVPLEGQNALQYDYNGVRVIVNGDSPWRSTAYYPGT